MSVPSLQLGSPFELQTAAPKPTLRRSGPNSRSVKHRRHAHCASSCCPVRQAQAVPHCLDDLPWISLVDDPAAVTWPSNDFADLSQLEVSLGRSTGPDRTTKSSLKRTRLQHPQVLSLPAFPLAQRSAVSLSPPRTPKKAKSMDFLTFRNLMPVLGTDGTTCDGSSGLLPPRMIQ